MSTHLHYRFLALAQANEGFSVREWQNSMGHYGIGCKITLPDDWWMALQRDMIYLDIVFDSDTDLALFALRQGVDSNTLVRV